MRRNTYTFYMHEEKMNTAKGYGIGNGNFSGWVNAKVDEFIKTERAKVRQSVPIPVAIDRLKSKMVEMGLTDGMEDETEAINKME